MPNTQGTTLMGDVAERNDIVLIEKGMADESGVTSLKERFIRDGLSQPIGQPSANLSANHRPTISPPIGQPISQPHVYIV